MDNDDYYYAGVAIAVSLTNGGPPPRFLSVQLWEALVSGPDSVKVACCDLPESTIKDSLKLVRLIPVFCQD